MLRRFILATSIAFAFVAPSFAQEPTETALEIVGGETSPVADAEIPAPAVEPSEPGVVASIFDNLFESIAGLLMVLVGGCLTWLSAQMSKWFGSKVELDKMAAALHWEDYADQALELAKAYAVKKIGKVDALVSAGERGGLVFHMINFLNSQYADVMKEWDKDQNGAVDWIETKLPPVSETIGKGVAVAAAARRTRVARVAKLPPAAKPKVDPLVAQT